jgi:hypothetical protein
MGVARFGGGLAVGVSAWVKIGAARCLYAGRCMLVGQRTEGAERAAEAVEPRGMVDWRLEKLFRAVS